MEDGTGDGEPGNRRNIHLAGQSVFVFRNRRRLLAVKRAALRADLPGIDPGCPGQKPDSLNGFAKDRYLITLVFLQTVLRENVCGCIHIFVRFPDVEIFP